MSKFSYLVIVLFHRKLIYITEIKIYGYQMDIGISLRCMVSQYVIAKKVFSLNFKLIEGFIEPQVVNFVV